jgi:arginine/lysine/ornithine decarboxylase
VRDGKGAIDHHRFNQAYMMHTTTSPLYAIVASNDITTAMMDGDSGRSLTQEAIVQSNGYTLGNSERAQDGVKGFPEFSISGWPPLAKSRARLAPYQGVLLASASARPK